MKFFTPQQNSAGGTRAEREQALTLVEMMVAMGVFTLVVAALVYAHMFGMSQDQLVQSKLGASQSSRSGFDKLARDIRSAKIWRVGNGNFSSFTADATNGLQQGNALQINITIDTNTYIRYYFDTSKGTLLRMHSGDVAASVIASNLINTLYFQAEDYLGNVKSDLSYKYVIHTVLQFQQFQYPKTMVGPGYYYDYYKMEFRVTPHCPDGT